MAGITEQQILDAINAARTFDLGNPLGALTCREITKQSSMGKCWVGKMLSSLVESGVLKVTKVRKMKIDGSPGWVPGYYLPHDIPSDVEN